MKTRYILYVGALAALLSGCAKETAVVSAEGSKVDDGVLYSFTATASDPMTRSFFKEEEAPSRYIYWEDTDEFDFHDITIGESKESVSVTSAKPTSMGASKKSVLFEKKGHDYMVISYPKGAVTLLDSTFITTYVTKATTADTLANNAAVKVSVPKVQALSSVLTPANLPMVSSRLALSDKAKDLISSGKDTISTDFVNPVKLTPLAGLAKMTILGLPDVTNANVTKVNILSEFDAKTYTGMPQRGLRGDNIISLKDTMAVIGNWVSGDSRFDISLTGGTVGYTAENGATVCFVANHSEAAMKTIQVAVYTSDGAVYKKTFDTSTKLISFSKSRVSSFSLDFTSGSVSKAASSRFSVEWSKGYLVYDGANKSYKIGDKQDIGLYFKFGSANAIAFYDSNEDWLSRIKPSNLVPIPIPGTDKYQEGTADGQTMKNGTDNFFSTQSSMATSWRTRKAYTVSGSTVTESDMTSETDYFAWQGSSSFAGANDPCALVKVADGEKKWRMPTLEDVNDLISVGAAGIEFGNFDGSDIRSSDGKSRFIRYTDGEQDFYLMSTGCVSTKITKKYKLIQMTFSPKYEVNFPTDKYTGTDAAQTNTSKNYCSTYSLSLSSAPGKTTAARIDKGIANTYTSGVTDTTPLWDAFCVRCVRDK